MDDAPFRADYAKSSRSSCNSCRSEIEKGHLRLAAMVQSSKFDSKIPNWYHFTCFFLKQRPKTVGDIDYFESLRWEDQERIRELVDMAAGSSSSAATGTKRKQSQQVDELSDFSIQYSTSSRAKCGGCETIIFKTDIRISKKDYESSEGRQFGGLDRWYHLDCFAKCRVELEFWADGSKLPGFQTLMKEDKDKVTAQLPEMKPIKKEENGEKEEKQPKLDNTEILKEQNEELYTYRDALKSLSKYDTTELLEYNNQQVLSNPDDVLDRLADAMTFGALLSCKECKGGQLVFRSGVGYFCLGFRDEWARCETVVTDPDRKPFCVPERLRNLHDFLNSYKFKPQKRIFEKHQPSNSTPAILSQAYMNSINNESTSGPKVEKLLPLKNMEIALVFESKEEKSQLNLEVCKLGGKVTSKITANTMAIISTPEMIQKKGSYIEEAQKLNVQIVPVSFIQECQKADNAIQLINSMNLVEWGSDPTIRMSADVVDSEFKSKSMKYKSNAPSKQKLIVEGGVAVDPASTLEDVAHVYREGDNIYNAVLSYTDIQSGGNSYYKLQVLESECKTRYWLFRSWGRIGTTIGDNKLEKFPFCSVIDNFELYFDSKTGNSWDQRRNFVKVPGKMTMMDICYEEENVVEVRSKPSKLEVEIQQLVSLLFDITTMKKVMMEMELDLEKMPLGKLSKKQIQQAYQVLTQLQNEIQESEGERDVGIFISLTNQFFTLIPHDFHVAKPPLLNTLDMIKEKVTMLDTLMDIEIAYSMLNDDTAESSTVNSIDSHYLKLKSSIQVLNKLTEEFKLLDLFVKNTHSETARDYELEIVEVFKVDRKGENKRFKPFKQLHNRKLLWHGSRLTNFAGILSQGLRIAPPEAPVSGYMFGKGIYFADMVSKSAGYCMTNRPDDTGLLLLCEVALGDCHELDYPENIVNPPEGKHSVKGMGKTHPDPTASVITSEGVEIPLGKEIPSQNSNTWLRYNEYIVYNVAQVKIRYLIQMKFIYNCNKVVHW